MGLQPLADEDPRHVGGFRLLFRLGAGGMGRVYLGRSPGGRMVALKTVHPHLAEAPGFRERFAREVRACQTLSGTGTVPLISAGPKERIPWLASAYVPGPSLAEAVSQYGPLPEPSLWRLLAGLAEALAEVHAHGLVHRDLKPSNVLLSSDRPRLIDFGIARALDETSLTATGVAVGTPGFMSPEQAEGHRLSTPSDVFSLGALLVYAATGRGPFGAGSGPGLLYRVVHAKPDLAGVPSSLVPLVARCLAKDPARRPPPHLILARTAPYTGTGADWLPAPVAQAIARRAEELLNLETLADPGENPRSYTPTQLDPGAAPRPYGWRPAQPGYPAGYGPARPPQWGWRAPARQATPGPPSWIAPWVLHFPLGQPLLALVTLAPAGLTLISRVPRYLRSPDQTRLKTLGDGRLVTWAAHDPWHTPLTAAAVLLCLALIAWRPHLHKGSPTAVRLWTAGTAVLWLLVAAVGALLPLVGWAAAKAADLNVEVFPISWLWLTSPVMVPLGVVGGCLRLLRVMAGGISRTGASAKPGPGG